MRGKLCILTLMLLLSVFFVGCSNNELGLIKAMINTSDKLSSGVQQTYINIKFNPDNKVGNLGFIDSKEHIIKIDAKTIFERSFNKTELKANSEVEVNYNDILTKLDFWEEVDLNSKDSKNTISLKLPKVVKNLIGDPEIMNKDYIYIDILDMIEKLSNNSNNINTNIVNSNTEAYINLMTENNTIFKDVLIDILEDFNSNVTIKKSTEDETENDIYTVKFNKEILGEFIKEFIIYFVNNEEHIKDIQDALFKSIRNNNSISEDDIRKLNYEFRKYNKYIRDNKDKIIGDIESGYNDFLDDEMYEELNIELELTFVVNNEEIVVNSIYDLFVGTPIGEMSFYLSNELSQINEELEVILPQLTNRNSVNLNQKIEEEQRKDEIRLDSMYRDWGYVGVKINNQRIYFNDIQPKIINGRVMVPIRELVEKIDGEVKWNASDKTIVCTRGNKKFVIDLKNEKLISNEIETKQYNFTIIDGRTLIPIRALSEAFDGEIQWNEEYKYTNINID